MRRRCYPGVSVYSAGVVHSERCLMVEMIGLATLCILLWVLASSMATESDSETRRVALLSGAHLLVVDKGVRHAVSQRIDARITRAL